ncbi:MAG: hypothetical protein M3040_12090 [Bacteroidota bacterium]|nr:hypothetical protein [Bacteroidota bacterium]
MALQAGIQVLRSFCQIEENFIAKGATQLNTDKREKHLLASAQSEKDFFEVFVDASPDCSNPVVITLAK